MEGRRGCLSTPRIPFIITFYRERVQGSDHGTTIKKVIDRLREGGFEGPYPREGGLMDLRWSLFH